VALWSRLFYAHPPDTAGISGGGNSMESTVADIIRLVDAMAPPQLAEQWDNVGLQLGKRDWTVRTVWVALDPLPEVVAEACRQNVNLLITHHPLIFHPLHTIDMDTPMGTLIQKAMDHRLAIYSAHTNLDIAAHGLNDILAQRIGLKNIQVLGEPKDTETQLVVMVVPAEKESAVSQALSARDKPVIVTPVSVPDTALKTPRVRIETVLSDAEIPGILHGLEAVLSHPEAVSYKHPLIRFGSRQGLGRVGDLERGMDFGKFFRMVKHRLGLDSLRVVGDPDLPIYRAAVCSGSGSGFMGRFLSSKAQVYITGDLRYHDARTAQAENRALIDVGHFASEHLVLEPLSHRLQTAAQEKGYAVKVEPCRLEMDPFVII
jgi:dinuclear metal center YbgI/SA1388 family protein